MKGERNRLLIEVSELKKMNQQLTAAALDKAKFEGAYLALIEGEVSTDQSDVVEAEKGESADNEPIWKRVGRAIKKRF